MKAKIGNLTKEKKEKVLLCFLYLSLIILTIPRSLDSIAPKVYDGINILKILIFGVSLLLVVVNKIRLSKLTKNVIIYSTFLFLVTLLNKVVPITFLKVYLLNIGILLLCEVVFNSRFKRTFIKFYSNYFFILLVLNFIGIIWGFSVGNESAFLIPRAKTYFLGQDNRFILYIIPTIIGYYYLYEMDKNKSNLILMATTYCIGLISLVSLWSVAALCVLILLGLVFVVSKIIRKKINIYMLSIFVLLLCVAIVFFRVQNLFRFFVVDILHKSLDLSYRTIIWDDAIAMFKANPINLIFGFGYFDTMNTFTNLPVRVGHLHNILMNSLFFSGIIGTVIYFYKFYLIENKIYSLKSIRCSNSLTFLFIAILVLMIFDTFELYQIYYFTLFLLFKSSDFLEPKIDKSVKEYKKNNLIEPKDKVGIMLATYNGEKYIREQLDSIIAQTYTNWVIFISDDHSTDNTLEILQEYKLKLKEKLVILENENKFASAKLNFANLFEKVNGMDYYMFCDQDDVWNKNKILDLLVKTKIEEKTDKIPVLTYCDSKIVDEKLTVMNNSLVEYSNKHLPEKNLMKHVLLENYFPGCAVFFNQELKDKIETIYKDCEMHDWWLTLTAALCGKIIFLNEPLHYYRQHGNNTVGAHKDDSFFVKVINRIKKLFDLNKTKTTWKNYQKTVMIQANELYKIYSEKEEIKEKNLKDIEKFINIMKTENKFKRLFLLIFNGYVPVEKIRVLRLVL